MFRDVLLEIRSLFEKRLQESGFVLVDMRFFKNQAHMTVLEVLADRPDGGITLDECGRLNRELGEMLEQSGLLGSSYTLDVSSPGMDRPLSTAADFRRSQGRDVRFFLGEPVEGKIEYCGRIEDVKETSVWVRIKDKKEEKIIEIPLQNINKAKQVIA